MKRVFTVLLALVTGIVLMTSCQTAEAAPHSATPGTYTVTAHGWYGDFPVSVTVSGTAITDISYEGAQEAAYLGGKALPLMVERIKAANTAGVDTVAGATMSSAAFKAAVVEALKQAKASAAFTAAPPKAASRAETLETDLLVIGSGAAGFSAAIAAKEGGVQNVLIIEKNDLIGGSTITSAGIVYAALDEDDIPGMVDYYMGRANQQADRTMLQFFAENSLGTISFLQDHGWVTPFAGSAGTAPESRARFSGGFSGQDLINPLEASAKSLGIVIKTDVTATGLIQANGAIVGAKAVNRAGNISYTINAKAVMLATGGYDASQEMLAQYNPRSAGDITLSNKGNTGDGIRMGVAVGAATVFKGGIIGFEQVDWSLAGGDTGNAMAKTNYIREDGSLVDLNVGSYAMNATDYPIVHTALLRARDEGATKFFTLLDSTP
ncbi:MAG: FAD-dependent oxidoreductase, partial [Treponema sp.]|nr:FAD-dependent oxidoreductase [Treponema sp.]